MSLLSNFLSIFIILTRFSEGLRLWCLMPLSTIFQLYRGGERRSMDPLRKPQSLSLEVEEGRISIGNHRVCNFPS